MNKRRKFISSFKTKVVLEALSARFTLQELARKQDLYLNQLSQWKTQFLANAESVFEKPNSGKSAEELEKERFYRIIGQQKIAMIF